MTTIPETSVRPVPPGVTEAELDRAITAFAAAIGSE